MAVVEERYCRWAVKGAVLLQWMAPSITGAGVAVNWGHQPDGRRLLGATAGCTD